MSTRISSVVASLLLAACGARTTPDSGGSVTVDRENAATAFDERIFCAHREAPLSRDCSVEATQDANRGLILTLRHPDGGFHRLLVTDDGRGVVAADGARYALVSKVEPGGIEVAIDGDRYRLPAMPRKRAS